AFARMRGRPPQTRVLANAVTGRVLPNRTRCFRITSPKGGAERMKVLVIGKGGREHALVWKLAQSSRVERVYCAPGNAGTAEDGVNVPIDVNDFDKLSAFVRKEGVGLTVVGPEEPLARGIVDVFQQ